MASAGLDLAPEDVAALEAVAAEVEAEYGLTSPAVLCVHLGRLMRRSVPLRGLQDAGASRMGGLQFADGTVVLVRGQRAGDLGRIAVGIYYGSAHLDDFHAESGRVTLEVSCRGRHDQLSALGVTVAG